MEMCVHATIAASVLLGRAGLLPQGRATVETPLGPLGVTWGPDAAVVDQFAPIFGAEVTDVSRVASALRIAPGSITGPVRLGVGVAAEVDGAAANRGRAGP